jgi:hypothetical protein
MKIPNIKEIIKPRWSHKPGFGMCEKNVLRKRKGFEQSTTPKDRNLLKKLGIKKGDKVLAIASYYASWASEIAKLGAIVDYSDISRSMVNWAKKKYRNLFGKYICYGYELIPKNIGEYDWTFTYEACGGGSGLPIAYLRSLLNNKGGILVLFLGRKDPKKMGGKLRTYPQIVKNLGEIYSTKNSIKNVNIKSHRLLKKEINANPFMIAKLETNSEARQLAQKDLNALFSGRINKESLKRLSKLSKIISKEFLKDVK